MNPSPESVPPSDIPVEQAAEFYRSLFENRHTVMLLLDPQDGRILDANPAAVAFYGWGREALCGKCLPDLECGLAPELLATLSVAREVGDLPVNGRHQLADGTARDVEMFSGLIHLEGRELLHVILHDITNRRAMEEKLYLRSGALDAAANVIVITDSQGNIEWANKAFQNHTGYSFEEAIGRNPRSLVKSGKQKPEFYKKLWKTIQAGKVWSGELVNRRKDGSLVTEEMTITPLRDEQGAIRHFVAVKQDISERKRLEEQFLRAQRMESIGTLAGGIAHDINNVLAPILLAVDMLMLDEENADRLQMLATIAHSAQHGADLVRQVLAFSRGLDGEKIQVNLRHIAKEIEGVVHDTFPKNITFQLLCDRDIWGVEADPTQMHQVLMNLCVNARDAMLNGGTLTVSLRNVVLDELYVGMNPLSREGPHLLVEVMDDGTGMSKEVKDRIFDPFFTTKEPGRGTGLGLPTVMSIVRGHDGFMTVYSEPNCGATFKVYLPAMLEAKSEPITPEVADPIPMGRGETILVVDDEENIRKVTSHTLERMGYRVLTAAHGAEAVQLFVQHKSRVAAVLMDMMMPVMDGHAAIVALQAIEPTVKVICSSGHASDGGISKAIHLGIQNFIPKPYTAEALARKIAAVVRGTPAGPSA